MPNIDEFISVISAFVMLRIRSMQQNGVKLLPGVNSSVNHTAIAIKIFLFFFAGSSAVSNFILSE